MPRKLSKSKATKADLVQAVADILNLSPDPRYAGRRGGSPVLEVVNTILKTIVEALWRGEEVRIDGFGIFKVHERKAIRRNCFFVKDFSAKSYHEVIDIPARRRVIFKPSKPLLRFINSK